MGLAADKGFDGQTASWTDGIPPIRRGRRLRSFVRQLRAAGIYGRRWKSETVISVIKRECGAGVRSRLGWLARRELVVKGWFTTCIVSFLFYGGRVFWKAGALGHPGIFATE